MSNVRISDLPDATLPLTGAELYELTQGGFSRKTTVADSRLGFTTSFVVVSADANLPNERILTAGTGIDVVDGGAGSSLTISATSPLSVTHTVGVGGDFATINAALEDLSSRSPIVVSPQVTTTLQLLSGFIMDEQVLADGVDLSWIQITSVDVTVTITGSSMDVNTLPVDGASTRYAFGADNGGVLPRINTLFSVDGTGSAVRRDGLVLINGSRAIVESGKGITNTPDNGLTLDKGAFLFANTANFSGAGAYGAFLYGGSRMVAASANFSNATDDGVIVTRGATASIPEANVSGAGVNGILATQGAIINAGRINADNCGGAGIRARGASVINANSCSAQNCQDGVFADRACKISVTDDTVSANFTGCSRYSLFSRNGAEISGENIVCGAARIFAELGGFISATGVTVATTGVSHHGILANTGARVNVDGGTISAAGTSAKALLAEGAEIWANNTTLTSSLSNTAQAADGGFVRAFGSVLNVVTGAACFANGGEVFVPSCTFNAVDLLIFDTLNGGLIDAATATINWSVGPPGTAFRVRDGAKINVSGTTEGANVVVNTIVPNGIVIQ
jgi:hypothetical protein